MVDTPDSPFLEPSDLAWLAAIPALTAVSWTLPDRACESLSRTVAGLTVRARPAGAAAEAARIARLLGARIAGPAAAEAIVIAHKAQYHLERIQIFRCHRPGGWAPRVALQGREHLDAALAAGKGAILYVEPSVWNHVVAKMAFHQAGFRVSHLSRPDHGFCKTRFGAKVLNPIQISLECRYLEERLVVDPDGGTTALRELSRRLRQNGLISIIAGSQALRTYRLPFLDGAIRLAGGPAALALQTGAALLPVRAVRERDGSFTTAVTAPIRPPAGGSREERVTAMMADYVKELEAFVLGWPEQFSGWHDVTDRDASPAPAT